MLKQNFYNFTQEHSLALVTQIRKLLVINQDHSTFSDVIEHTSILVIICNIFELNMPLNPDLAYYMQAEALWILNNLACTEERSVMFILQSDVDQDFSDDKLDMQKIEDDVKFAKSRILQVINNFMV